MPRIVKAYGRPDAPIMWIGEAPGKEEVKEGKPFVAPSGVEVRQALRMYGIDDEEDVYWVYAVGINPGDKFPTGKAGAVLLKEWASTLDKVLLEATPKVVVLCGGQALRRVTGFSGINDWTGSVLRPDDIPKAASWHKGVKHNLVLPDTVEAIIPVLHPAGILLTKGKDDIPIFYRGVEKAALALKDSLTQYPFFPVLSPSIKALKKAAEGKTVVALDTEFNPETKELFQFGLTFDGNVIYGFQWLPQYFQFVRDLMADESVTKVAHNIRADWDILEFNHAPIKGPTYCTMIGTYVLHPEFMVGLSPSSRFYLDDVKHTKWMDKTDPIYNCYDVQYCWLLKEAQEEELRSRKKQTGTDQKDVMASRQTLIEGAWRMEDQGMLLDNDLRKKFILDQDSLIAEYGDKVDTSILPFWTKRTLKAQSAFEGAKERYEGMRLMYKGRCKKHPTYYPAKKPPKQCEICISLHQSSAGEKFRNAYDMAQKFKAKEKKELDKVRKGFNFNSNDDLAWLLYSADALNMPIRRKKKTRKPSTDADAIERLSQSKIAQKKEGFHVIQMIKDMQQAAKAKSTFLEIPYDDDFYVHPPYKVHGTRTGRIASGEDTRGEIEKVSKKDSINILNYPEVWRQIYIAPPGYCIVAADWKNQEGRLMAYFSKDKAYRNAFRSEDAGGIDVHSLTAGIIYGIDPSDARATKTKFNGSLYDMRHCAKVANHAVSYSPTPIYTLMKNFQLPIEEASRIVNVLNDARPGIPAYKNTLVRQVLGTWEAVVGQTPRPYAVCVEPGSRWDTTPFGWLLYFWGGAVARADRENGGYLAIPDQAGEVIALRQQASGAEMWTRCCNELRKIGIPYTGTYDSFYMLCEDTDKARQDMAGHLRRIMEQPWPELNGWTFPIDIEWGYNLRHRANDNPNGLRELK